MFVYAPTAGTVLSAGNGQTLSVQFTPSDLANYVTVSATVAINVVAQPVISDGPTIDASTITVLQPVTFSCAANQGSLIWSWNFGDGTTSSGATMTHSFTLAGTYTVTVTATNHVGLSVSKTLAVTVAPAGAGGRPDAIDSDGDGFSDELEIGAGTSPFSATSTPLDNQPAGQILPLTISKLSTKLNFEKAGRESISFFGTLPVPNGFSAARQRVIVDVGEWCGHLCWTARAARLEETTRSS